MTTRENCDDPDLLYAKQMVIDAVCETQTAKREDGRFPDYATLNEITSYTRMEASEVLKVLRGLYKGNRIVHRSTVNGIHMFGVKESNEHNSKIVIL